MKQQTLGLRVAATIFGLVAGIHVVRLLTRFQVVIGGWEPSLWFSGVFVIVAVSLAVWMWKLTR